MKLTIIPEGPVAFNGKDYLNSEGEGVYIDSLSKYFDEVIVYAYAFHKGDLWYDSACNYKFQSNNIKIVELPLCRGRNISVLSKAIQIIKVAKIVMKDINKWDMIYLFIPGYPSAVVSVINTVFHKPYFVYVAFDWCNKDMMELMFRWKGIVKKIIFPVYYRANVWFEKKIISNAIFVLTAGSLLYNRYIERGKNVAETIPRLNWTQIKLFKRNDTCRNLPLIFLFVGSLSKYKGAKYLIEACSLLKSRGISDIKIRIVGTGDQKFELEELVDKFGIKDKIEFLGHISNGPELYKMYREADIFIFPTLGEGFPRVLYEAMSQSIPIVTTNVSGIPYKMKHEENALLVLPRDAEAIADAVERLVNDGELRRKMISGGYKFMEQMIQNNDGGKQVYDLLQKHYAKG
ncbi:MAG: glycosyltransferase [bacterium]|nr:glycosyltransferase [bacterium]